MRPSLLLVASLAAAGAFAHQASATDLPPATRDALFTALADEYHAEAFYAAVLDKFGEVRPFSNIIVAEQRHAEQLRTVMERYGLDAGENADLGSKAIIAAVPETLAEACAIGVEAEVANRDLYDKTLLPAAVGYDDITAVFISLRDASENNHLPAFQRCGGQTAGNGPGHGKGHGMGGGSIQHANP